MVKIPYVRWLFIAPMLPALAFAGCMLLTPAPNPGPNPACASAANAVATAQQGFGIAQAAWSIGAGFVANPTVRLAITTALDSASAGLAKAQASILAGDCNVSSYVTAAATAIQTALADIADARTQRMAAPMAGPDALGALIDAGNAKAEAAKAAAGR